MEPNLNALLKKDHVNIIKPNLYFHKQLLKNGSNELNLQHETSFKIKENAKSKILSYITGLITL